VVPDSTRPMQGYLALVLHAHLPWVRHPEHEKFLEENWLFEAITETYIPLLQIIQSWQREGLNAPLTLTLTPTLCSMLQDPLLQERYARYLDGLIELAEKEVQRTQWEKPFQELALFYRQRFRGIREFYISCGRNLLGEFKKLQDVGALEIITSAATHALLPLLAKHEPSLRAQILIGCDHYRSCFGRDPRGIWLPECAYVESLDPILKEAGLRWFITDTRGILNARPRPRYAMFAPLLTSNGIAAFVRDQHSARQVWSREEGYPGDPWYRDFYRDIGFDLDLDYVKPFLPAPQQRSFTGIKYHRITSRKKREKEVYERAAAVRTANRHAGEFLEARTEQLRRVGEILDRPPLLVSAYDAELFGHWWYEGPEFLDYFVRKASYDQKLFTLITPEQYLQRHPTNQVATPGGSSWGEGGYLKVWLNEKNEWIYPHLDIAQQRMSELARKFTEPDALQERALKQAARELLLAQSSDWPFILSAETSAQYAQKRFEEHVLHFTKIYEGLNGGHVEQAWLSEVENRDSIFPDVNYRLWLEK